MGGGRGTIWSLQIDAPVVPKISIQSALELLSVERNLKSRVKTALGKTVYFFSKGAQMSELGEPQPWIGGWGKRYLCLHKGPKTVVSWSP